jgi:large subunit ribosomal protein L30e
MLKEATKMAIEDEIKSALAKGTVIIGTRRVTKAVKAGEVKAVVLASNAPEEERKDFEHYAKAASVNVKTFNGTGKQLGVFLGKPFPVAALAIRPEGKGK